MKAIGADLPSRQTQGPDPNQLDAGLAHISSLTLAEPDASFTQQDVLELLDLSGDEFAQRIFSRCGIQRRQLRLTDELLATTVQGRTLAIEEHLLEDSVRAIDALRIDPSEIGVVISASLYSLAGPTLAHRLVDHYEMDPSTDKYHVLGVGCASAVPLMRLASQALRERHGQKALVVAAESMAGILMAARPDDTRSKTVGSAIFGDGCAAALIELADAETDIPADAAGQHGPAIVASKVHQIPGTLGAVRMHLTPEDSYLHLVRELPDMAGDGLEGLVEDFLGALGLGRAAIDHWLIHPGGRRIIDSIQQALELSDADVAVSREVLAEHGNVGTASIFYVLRRMLDSCQPRAGELGLMVTVGPGVTVGLMLLRW